MHYVLKRKKTKVAKVEFWPPQLYQSSFAKGSAESCHQMCLQTFHQKKNLVPIRDWRDSRYRISIMIFYGLNISISIIIAKKYQYQYRYWDFWVSISVSVSKLAKAESQYQYQYH